MTILLVLAGCASIPDDMDALVQSQYPQATITNRMRSSISQGRVSQNVTDAWCIEFSETPSPVVVYRDDEGLHIFEAFGYGIASCSELQTF